jgi:hypothetical protein
MKDGREYESTLDCIPVGMNIRDELRRALAEIEAIRGRPAVLYAGNVVATQSHLLIAMTAHDELPFAEMIDAVHGSAREVDVVVVTPGGSAQTASCFVDKLRSRFDHVAFIIPNACMSAGTILVLSGDQIWMDERSSLGPIDPQVLGREGRFVPLQALWVLLKEIADKGRAAIAKGHQPCWSHLQLLRNIDTKELGDALSATRYVKDLAAGYLEKWKFRGWTVRTTSGMAVDTAYRRRRASEIADALCNHDLWKMHSHRLPRDVVEQNLRLRVERCESVPGLQRAMRRLWVLMYFIFENSHVVKIIMSQDYALVHQRT